MKRIDLLLRSFASGVILASCSTVIFSAAVQSVPAIAEQRGPVQRVVQGRVLDSGGTLVKGAIVYLKDDHSLSVKSYFSDEKGEYRFGQLSQTADYQIWAENNGKKSAVKTISSFNTKAELEITLKIDSGK